SSAASLVLPVVMGTGLGLAFLVRLAALGPCCFGAHRRCGPLLRLRIARCFIAWLLDARLFAGRLVARLLHAGLAGRGSGHLLLADRGGPPGVVGALDLRHLRQRGTRGPLAVVLLGAGN